MRYDNDPRVVKLNDDWYDLPSQWFVERRGDQWIADVYDGTYKPNGSSHHSSVDDAIAAVIGDPR